MDGAAGADANGMLTDAGADANGKRRQSVCGCPVEAALRPITKTPSVSLCQCRDRTGLSEGNLTHIWISPGFKHQPINSFCSFFKVLLPKVSSEIL